MVLGLIIERTTQVVEMKGALHLNTRIYLLPRASLILAVPLLEYLLWARFGFDWLVIGLVAATSIGLVTILLLNAHHFGGSRAE